MEAVFVCVCVCVVVCVRVDSKTPPCADSNRLRVCRQNARVTLDTGVLLAHTKTF